VLGPDVGIPQIFWFGCEHGYKALVMDFLGPSLEELFNKCTNSFFCAIFPFHIEVMTYQLVVYMYNTRHCCTKSTGC